MPRMCCVPGCKSNYHTEESRVSVFRFPKDAELRKKWITAVSRDNYTVTNNSVVCEKHFSEELIIRVDSVKRSDGSVLEVSRDHPKLQHHAVPHIFQNQPKYRSTVLPPKRTDPDLRRIKIFEKDNDFFQNWLQNDIIDLNDFKSFVDKVLLKEYTDLGFVLHITNEFILFYKIDAEKCPKISISFKIFQDFTVKVWFENTTLSLVDIKIQLNNDNKLDKWSQLDNIVSRLSSFELNTDTSYSLIKSYANSILQCIECNTDLNEQKAKSLCLLIKQVHLHIQKQHRYCTDTIIWAYTLYLNDSYAYDKLRRTNVLCLPHPNYLKRLSSLLGTEKSGLQESHIEYISKKASLLSNDERIISLMLDEIYVKPQLSYKSGTIYGLTENMSKQNLKATTVQCFMIHSIMSKNRDVVALFPVCNLTGDDLYKLTQKVLEVLTLAGYIVISIVSDNIKVNIACFKKFGGGKLTTCIKNPFQEEQKIFLLFDSVHLLKNIRNNWFCQKDTEQTFTFPAFTNHSKVLKACVGDLKKVYFSEVKNIVKLAPNLWKKVLFPTSIQKQNVLLATHVFNEKNVIALQHAKGKISNHQQFDETCDFLDIIIKWWKIVNVKHPLKYCYLRDPYCEPIKKIHDTNVVFLRSFLDWLNSWDIMAIPNVSTNSRCGKLTLQTHEALRHTVKAFTELIPYLLDVMKFDFVLLGKFQTDMIEGRFGMYRQMSGGNYNVSVQQLLESERKLKLIGLLRMKSSKKGEISIVNFLKSCEYSSAEDRTDFDIEVGYENVIEKSEIVAVTLEDQKVLVFIAGYVSHAVKKSMKLECMSCNGHLVLDTELEIETSSSEINSYLSESSRGGLKWPTDSILSLTLMVYKVFQILLTQEYEEKFLASKNHRAVLKTICLELNMKEFFNFQKCINCGLSAEKLEEKCIVILCNIFINNYCKIENDAPIENQKNTKKRKLSTFYKT